MKKLGKNNKVLIIAEAGINHNGNLKIAKKLIDVCKNIGADAVKFQTFKAENVISKFATKLNYQKNKRSDKQSQLEMLKSFELSDKEFLKLKKYCEKKKIIFMSTPKDLESAEFLNKIKMKIFKIGSGEANNYELINKISNFNKKTIISTGMCTLDEVKKIYKIFKGKKKKNLCLLHCTSLYPCPSDECNLSAIITMKNFFDVDIGFSDHTIGIDASIGAVALGSRIIEKHITLDKKMKGPDHKASLDPVEFEILIKKIRLMERMIGNPQKKPTQNEKKNIKLIRRGLVYKEDLAPGYTLRRSDIQIKRPMLALKPDDLPKVIGKKLRNKVYKDQPIILKHFK